MEDHGVSLNTKCACIQKECPLWGNCVLCVQNHVEYGNHTPECIQDMMRDSIIDLARKVELKCADKRPGSQFWEKADKEKIVRDAKKKHPGQCCQDGESCCQG